MEPVLYAPVAARRLDRAGGGERRWRDGGARLEAAAAGKFGARLDPDDAGGAGQPTLASETPVAVEPIAFSHGADGSLVDAAVALVVAGDALEARGISVAEDAFRPGAQGGWLALTATR